MRKNEPLAMPDPRYPIGPFVDTAPHSPAQRLALIDRIATLPARFREKALSLSEQQLDMPYRPSGWTARQVIHHVPDSHMHCLLRFKYALATDGAPILAYPEELWAVQRDYRDTPIALSLDLLSMVHAKWVVVLRGMTDADFARAFVHPANGRTTLDTALASYVWHGEHHLAHLGLV